MPTYVCQLLYNKTKEPRQFILYLTIRGANHTYNCVKNKSYLDMLMILTGVVSATGAQENLNGWKVKLQLITIFLIHHLLKVNAFQEPKVTPSNIWVKQPEDAEFTIK